MIIQANFLFGEYGTLQNDKLFNKAYCNRWSYNNEDIYVKKLLLKGLEWYPKKKSMRSQNAHKGRSIAWNFLLADTTWINSLHQDLKNRVLPAKHLKTVGGHWTSTESSAGSKFLVPARLRDVIPCCDIHKCNLVFLILYLPQLAEEVFHTLKWHDPSRNYIVKEKFGRMKKKVSKF